MQWFRQWHSFVREKDCDPPGPIDNTPIIYTNSKTGQIHLKQGLFVSFALVPIFIVMAFYIIVFYYSFFLFSMFRVRLCSAIR